MLVLNSKNKIIGEIDFLEEKLVGEIPIKKIELIYLINSWGRKNNGCISEYVNSKNNKIFNYNKCEPKECYDLSKLDISKIHNMGGLFLDSMFNGDLSNWNTSKVTSMGLMFYNSDFNSDISKWDVSNVIGMVSMFSYARNFNQDLSLWDTSKVEYFYCMFDNAKAFQNKFNNGKPLPEGTDDLKIWFNKNMPYESKLDKVIKKITNVFSKDKENNLDLEKKDNKEIDIIQILKDKIENNKKELNELLKSKNIDTKSKLGKDVLNLYNNTQDKLLNQLKELKETSNLSDKKEYEIDR